MASVVLGRQGVGFSVGCNFLNKQLFKGYAALVFLSGNCPLQLGREGHRVAGAVDRAYVSVMLPVFSVCFLFLFPWLLVFRHCCIFVLFI